MTQAQILTEFQKLTMRQQLDLLQAASGYHRYLFAAALFRSKA